MIGLLFRLRRHLRRVKPDIDAPRWFVFRDGKPIAACPTKMDTEWLVDDLIDERWETL